MSGNIKISTRLGVTCDVINLRRPWRDDGRPNNIYNKLLLNRANEKRSATMGHLTGRAKHEKKKRSF